jgi:hypothetical protein
MAKTIEQDGYTLRLGEEQDAKGGGGERQFLRVTLIRRPGLFGRNYNVRETRAQAFDVPNAVPRALGEGRLLAWRWQSLRDANALISHRLETLAGLGYEIVERSKGTRGEWDWLRDLVRQRLAGRTTQAAPNPRSGVEALKDALARLGIEPAQIIPGLAQIVNLSEALVTHPTPEGVSACDDVHLSVLIPFLIEHDNESLREIGMRWLAIPSVLYDVEPWVLREWALSDGPLAKSLVRRIEREGLALFGLEGLQALSSARRRDTRNGARRWLERLGEETRATKTTSASPRR